MRKPPGLHVIMKLRREERRRLDAEANRAARDNETEEEREERRRLDAEATRAAREAETEEEREEKVRCGSHPGCT